MTRASQTARIRAALERGERLTPLVALQEYGCFRLAGRIFDLRQEGLPIETRRVEIGDANVAEYRLTP